MIDTTPVGITDDQINALTTEHYLDDYEVKEFSDIERLLQLAQTKLNIPALMHIALWDTSDSDNADLMITVDEPATHLRLATETITWNCFAHPEGTTGAPAVRHALDEILAYRDRLVTDLAQIVTLATAG